MFFVLRDSIVSFCIAMLFGLAAWWTYHKYKAASQDRRDWDAALLFNAVKSGNVKTFCVFLRPFYVTNQISETTYTYSGSPPQNLQTYELEDAFIRAFDTIMPVVALGKPGEVFGVGRILVDENAWKKSASELMRRASLILCIPSMRPGSQWELDLIIQNGYLNKTVFLMPPEFYKRDKQDWTLVREHMRNNGLTIPRYISHGMFFSINANGVCFTERFAMKGLRSPIRKAVLRLIQHAKSATQQAPSSSSAKTIATAG